MSEKGIQSMPQETSKISVFKDMTEISNIDLTQFGNLIQRKGWKSFKGMIYSLKLMNKRYKKFGFSGEIIIKLPLK